jgi:hypothetical protein
MANWQLAVCREYRADPFSIAVSLAMYEKTDGDA